MTWEDSATVRRLYAENRTVGLGRPGLDALPVPHDRPADPSERVRERVGKGPLSDGLPAYAETPADLRPTHQICRHQEDSLTRVNQ